MKSTHALFCTLALILGAASSTPTLGQSPTQVSATRDPIWSPDGRHLAFVSNRSGVSHVYVARADGTGARQVTTGEGPFYYPEFSPDGTRLVAMAYRAPEVTIWTMNIDGSAPTRLTPRGEFNADPRWTTGGDAIVFSVRRNDEEDIYIMNPDGSVPRPITKTASRENTPVPSPNGRDLVVVSDREGQLGLVLMALDGSNPRMLTSDTTRMHLVPKWSPNGRQIAYYAMDPDAGNTSAEIMVFDVASGTHRQVTQNAYRDQGPAWSPDGSSLIFASTRENRTSLYSIDLATGVERPFEVAFADESDDGR